MGQEIFISYSQKNKAQADALYHALKRQGFSCWMAPHDIPPGTKSWPRAIAEAIRACRVFVLLFTEASNASEDVQQEVHIARDRRKEIVVVRLEDLEEDPGLEYLLKGRQHLHVAGFDFEEIEIRTVASLRIWLPPITQAPEIPVNAEEKTRPAPKQPVQKKEGITTVPGQIGNTAKSTKKTSRAETPAQTQNRPAAKTARNSIENAAFTDPFGIEFIRVPAGEFVMGSEKGAYDEIPLRTVQITQPFYLGKFLITQQQWYEVMGTSIEERGRKTFWSEKPRLYGVGSNNPMYMVSWEECQEFIRQLNHKSGGSLYRLPTEAEWEYACRSGSETDYCFGDDIHEIGRYAWYAENANGESHPVGEKMPNTWGLYDMHGNVGEWIKDWYASNYYASRPQPDIDPAGPEKGSLHVVRGGSWHGPVSALRSADRYATPGDRAFNVGFRLLRAIS